MKTRRKVLIALVGAGTGVKLADSAQSSEMLAGRDIKEDDYEYIEILNSGVNTGIPCDGCELEGHCWLSIRNNHESEPFRIAVRMRPVKTNTGFTLEKHTGSNIVEPGESHKFKLEWIGDKARTINAFDLEVKLCNLAIVNGDCTEWKDYGQRS